MNKISAIGVLVGTIMMSCVTVSWAGGIYRWVDEKGVTHFGEKPPGPGVGEKIQVNAPGPSSTSNKPEKASTPSTAPTGAPAASAPAVDPAVAQAQAEIVKKNCEAYAVNLKVLQEHGQIKEQSADGQVKMLTDEEKQSRIKEAEKYIAEKCQANTKKP